MSKERKTRIPRKITPKALESAALAYLQRYATSAANLRAVLMRRVHRAARFHDTDPEQSTELVDELISRYRRAGLLDDVAYAELRVSSLHRRGISRRGIQARLAAKGVAADDIDRALAQLQDEHEDSEFEAACNYARRRRIGPWRATLRSERRDRDLAALSRQGYGYELACRVIDAEDIETLEL